MRGRIYRLRKTKSAWEKKNLYSYLPTHLYTTTMMLNKLSFFIFFILFYAGSFAQINAVTETGDKVLLSSDGTWKYEEEIKNTDSTKTNPESFIKSADANFLLKSKISPIAFWINPKNWNFQKSVGDDASEYSFSLKENSAIGGMVVVEPLGMDLKSLRKISLENINKQSSKFSIVTEEYRTVNGLKVLLIKCDAVIQGIQIIYTNYYYTDSVSTVQFDTYMPKNVAAKYAVTVEAFLNGLVATTQIKAGSASKNISGIESSLAENNNCKAFFKGTWSYTANGKKYINTFGADKMIETSVGDVYKTEYKMQWLNNCNYQLTLLKSNNPAAKLIKAGAVFSVEIITIDANKMNYQQKYGEMFTSGEMQKEL